MIQITVFVVCLFSSGVLGDISMTSVPTSPDALGQDNPHYDRQTNSVYFADYFNVLLFRYSLAENKTYSCTVEGVLNPSFIFPVRDSYDQFLVGSNNSAVIVNWDGESDTGYIERTVFSVTPNTIINNAYVTESGDMYLGNYGPTFCNTGPHLSFYKYTVDGGLVEIANHYRSTVGVLIVEDTLYHLDACSQILSAYKRDPVTGEFGNERDIIQLQYTDGKFLVGLAADTDGNLYTGVYGGSVLTKIYPSEARTEEIEMPTPLVSAPGFGGQNRDILFVATANLPINPHTVEMKTPIRNSPAGNLFLIEGLAARGLLSYRPKIKSHFLSRILQI